MKILHIIPSLCIGGAESFLTRLIISQSKLSDIEHVVLTLFNRGELITALTNENVIVLTMDFKSNSEVLFGLFRLRFIISEIKPDIVQTWMYHSDLFGGIASLSLGIKNIIWSVRTTDISKGANRNTLVVRWLCSVLSHFIPKAIVCVGNRASALHRSIGYKSEKLVVIPNGFDTSYFQSIGDRGRSLREELGFVEDEIVIISIGRFNPIKDHQTFLMAAGLLIPRFRNVRFLLVGRELDWGNKKLISLLKKYGCLSRVSLIGERADIPICLEASDIFCLHSATEGFPNALGEAMSVGLPCVATDVGDAFFLLNKSEWITPPSSPIKLAEKLSQMILLSSAERYKLGEEGAIRIREHFTMQSSSNAYYALYQKIYFGLEMRSCQSNNND